MGLSFFLNSILLGAGLAMDAFSVSCANGLREPNMKAGRMVKIAGVYAFFQFAMPMAGWDDVLLMGAQLDPAPMDDDFAVHTMTVIGKHAAKPMLLDMPVYISHMSFGALSAEIKEALAKGSAMAKTAMCSGEGGILPEERAASYKYIFEYIPNKYSVTDENLKSSDAIEIKIGQGTKPGMGGHLPGSKVTPQIAAIRGRISVWRACRKP